MSSSNNQNGTVKVLNAYSITALLSLFIAGIVLLFMGFYFGVQMLGVQSGTELYQGFINAVIIIGLILIVLGVVQSLGIIKKTKRVIDLALRQLALGQRGESETRGGLKIIRPGMSSSEAKPMKIISASPRPAIQSQQITPKKPLPASKKRESQAVDITFEEALQKIIDRYNDPKVFIKFTNWVNTLMMTFPDLDKSYLYRINGDLGITLEEGFEEEAAVQVKLDSELLIKMLTKQINPIKAYSSGGLEVKGKMKNLLKLRKLMF